MDIPVPAFLSDNVGAMEKGHEREGLVPYTTYVLIWLALLVLTVLTVTVAGMHIKGLSVITALFIASAKSTLVLNIFMHLKYERSFFRVIILIVIVTIAIFIGLTFLDVLFR